MPIFKNMLLPCLVSIKRHKARRHALSNDNGLSFGGKAVANQRQQRVSIVLKRALFSFCYNLAAAVPTAASCPSVMNCIPTTTSCRRLPASRSCLTLQVSCLSPHSAWRPCSGDARFMSLLRPLCEDGIETTAASGGGIDRLLVSVRVTDLSR